MEILLIEEDERVLKDLKVWLRERYPQAEIVSHDDVDKGLDRALADKPDLVIVGMSLFESFSAMQDFIVNIRDLCQCPQFFLTGEDSEVKRSQAIEIGADECMSLPLKPIEFLARAGALLRQVKKDNSTQNRREIILGDHLTVDLEVGRIVRDDDTSILTRSEMKLLSILLDNENRIVRSDALIREVWGEDQIGDSNLLKQHIYRLRAKLEDDPGKPEIIVNHRGLGYKLVQK